MASRRRPPAGPALLVLCLLPLLLAVGSAAQITSAPPAASLTVGFVLPERGPALDASSEVALGLQFWAAQQGGLFISTSSGGTQVQASVALRTVNASDPVDSLGSQYVTLCLAGVYALVGPATSEATLEVAAALNQSAASGCPLARLMLALLVSDEALAAQLQALGVAYFTLVPPLRLQWPGPPPLTQQLAPVTGSLAQGLVTWAILAPNATSAATAQMAQAAALAAALAANLSQPADTAAPIYTVQDLGAFLPADTASLTAAVARVARLRPAPDVLAVSAPFDDPQGAALDQLYSAFASAGESLTPGSILLLGLYGVDYAILSSQQQHNIKYWSTNTVWDHSLALGSSASPLGTASAYWTNFHSRLNTWPSSWAALASASALVYQAAWTPTPGGWSPHVDLTGPLEPFWGPISLVVASPANASAPNGLNLLATWRWVQFLNGDTVSIGPAGVNSELAFPGRWAWVSYSLSGSAIAAIVLGTLLAAAGLAIAVYATYRFVDMWLHPPQENDDEDEKEKKD